MNLSPDEMHRRAFDFVHQWQNFDDKEIAESQTFWNDLFAVYGKQRSELARFEKSVKRMSGTGRIDLFWPGQLLVEQKGPAVALDDKVNTQAFDYIDSLSEEEKPRYVVLCNFKEFIVHNLTTQTQERFSLNDFVSKVHVFQFIAGYSEVITYQEEKMSLKAAALLGELYTVIEAGDNTPSLELNYFMVRLLYCFFADHTGLFSDQLTNRPFHHYLETHSQSNGADLSHHINDIFEVLNTPFDRRDLRLPEALKSFPYVNGALFSDTSYRLYGNASIRQKILEVAAFEWAQISPAIFGTLFQSITNPLTRTVRGEHYTSEANIRKAIDPLFMEALRTEFAVIKTNKSMLERFIGKLSRITVLDPACGSGNFLVVAYRELRTLELEALQHLHARVKERHLLKESVHAEIKVNVNQFYGIEIESLPSKIAQLALWLTDHQMNMEASRAFGILYTRLPLTVSATIANENALTCAWHELIEPKKLHYIVGNPPFYGARKQLKEQRAEVEVLFDGVKGSHQLDYVACWYKKCANMMKHNDKITAALVSTASITQGAQVFPLWNTLIKDDGIFISFAHRTFKWFNEAKNNAQVHCVVIGFSRHEVGIKHLYDYALRKDDQGAKEEVVVKRSSAQRINPYLAFSDTLSLVQERKTPLNPSTPMCASGSMSNDGGHLLLSAQEKEELLIAEPGAEKYIRRLFNTDEFLNNEERWCLWLVDANAVELSHLPHIMKRVQSVQEHRLNSKREATRKLADKPTLFGEMRQPRTDYLLIPIVSSQHRYYSPIGYMSKDDIVKTAISLENATPYLFGVLSSRLHQAWLATVGGRLKSDYQYSIGVVYNTFPFPPAPTAKQQAKVAALGQQVISVRQKYADQGMTLAAMYNKATFMLNPDLVKAHRALDKAVEACYRSEPFDNETDMERVTFLLGLYDHYINTLGLG